MKKSFLLAFCMALGIVMMSFSSNKNYYSGNITAAEFRAQLGLIAWLDHFDFDAHCTVESYTLLYTAKRQDPFELKVRGGKFKGKAKQLIQQAKPGDQYVFMNVKARCPGDIAGRKVNSLYFKIR